jgi:predicted lysophospholipase L1 biosynthesis ABC-type transport system permease subunit
MQDNGLKTAPEMQPDEALELRVTQALERMPEVRISEDFAARVVARLPARRVAPLESLSRLRETRLKQTGLRQTRYGYGAIVASLVVLLVALAAVAPRTAGHGVFWVVMECVLCGQFVALAAWLGAGRRGQISLW